jgi:hypothetical protein
LKKLRKLQKGFIQVIIGITGGIIISALMSLFQKNGLIPSDFVYWFTLVGFASSVISMISFKTAGVIFTLGWIAGAWLLKDILSPFDFVVYIIAPIVALGLRLLFFFKKAIRV